MKKNKSVVVLACLSLLYFPILEASASENINKSKNKVVLISLDGAGEKIINSVLLQDLMPNLKKIKQGGVHAAGSIPNYPSKTAPGHASIWTGAYGYKNGVTSNEIFKQPIDKYSVLDTERGFISTALQIEPIWITAIKQNKKVLITQSTHTYPFEPYFVDKKFGIDGKDKLNIFDGYGDIIGKDDVINEKESPLSNPTAWKAKLPTSNKSVKEINFKIANKDFYGLVFDDPKNKVNGYDSIAIATDKNKFEDIISANNNTFSKDIVVENRKDQISPKVFFRLFEINPTNGNFMLYHTEVSREDMSNKEFIKTHNNIPTFIGHGGTDAYQKGLFGKTIMEGGNGLAEQRFLETIEFSIDSFKKRATYAMNNFPDWDLLINYLPFPDGMLHTWYGGMDTQKPGHDPELAKKLTPYYNKVFNMVDSYLGVFLEKTSPETVISIVSDHGMMGVNKLFYPNVVLKNAGLLDFNEKGRIDLEKTKILYPYTDGSYLSVNKKIRKNGIVEQVDEQKIIDQAIKALMEAKDPETGNQIVNKVFKSSEFGKSLFIGGDYGGDLYIDLAYGYYFSSKANKNIVEDAAKIFFKTAGAHIYFPYQESMHAIFFIKGQSIKQNQEIGFVRTIDIAPTICKILGINPSKDSEGHILGDIFDQN